MTEPGPGRVSRLDRAKDLAERQMALMKVTKSIASDRIHIDSRPSSDGTGRDKILQLLSDSIQDKDCKQDR